MALRFTKSLAILAAFVAVQPVAAFATSEQLLPPVYEAYTETLDTASSVPLPETAEAVDARAQVYDALGQVLNRPLDEHVVRDLTLDEVQQKSVSDFNDKLQAVNVMQTELVQGVENKQVDVAAAKKMYLEVQSLKSDVNGLVSTLTPESTTGGATGTASVLPLPSEDGAAAEVEDTAAVSTETELTAAELAALEAELAYREELIRQLLESMGETVPESDTMHSSALSANLLAISENPVASGGIAIFAIMIIYLLRGRLAEFSGFGVKLTFTKSGSTKSAERRKARRRKTDS